eukprot:gene11182-15002_t
MGLAASLQRGSLRALVDGCAASPPPQPGLKCPLMPVVNTQSTHKATSG